MSPSTYTLISEQLIDGKSVTHCFRLMRVLGLACKSVAHCIAATVVWHAIPAGYADGPTAVIDADVLL